MEDRPSGLTVIAAELMAIHHPVVGWPAGRNLTPRLPRNVRDSLPSHGSYHHVGMSPRAHCQWANPRG
jgi:hypothetical protein